MYWQMSRSSSFTLWVSPSKSSMKLAWVPVVPLEPSSFRWGIRKSISSRSVSYTHLDVYKRQAFFSGRTLTPQEADQLQALIDQSRKEEET